MIFSLTKIQYDVLNKIAKRTKMDCWFSLVSGIKGYKVYDKEAGKTIPLKKGIQDLVEGMVEPIEDPFYRLSNEEIIAFKDLLKTMKIEA